MENSFYAPPNISPQKSKGLGFFKKILAFLGIIAIVFPLVIVAFYLGRQSQIPSSVEVETSDDQISPTSAKTDKKTAPTSSKSGSKPTPTPKHTPTPITVSKVLTGIKDLDGFRSSNSEGNQSLDIRVGRNNKLVTRGFVSFSLDDLPSGIDIKEASLRLFQTKVVGNPFAYGGSIKVDHLTYGNSLDDTDYGLAALTTNAAALPTTASVGWKETNVTQSVKDDIENGRSFSQFRIHFNVENTGENSTGDFIYFESSENYQGTGYVPQLVIKYY